MDALSAEAKYRNNTDQFKLFGFLDSRLEDLNWGDEAIRVDLCGSGFTNAETLKQAGLADLQKLGYMCTAEMDTSRADEVVKFVIDWEATKGQLSEVNCTML